MAPWSRRLLLSFVTMVATTSSAEQSTLATTSEVFLALREFFKADCISVVSSGSRASSLVAAGVSKMTSQRNISTTPLEATRLIETRERIRYCLRPLHLLLYDADDVRGQLSKLSKMDRFSDHVWLLFLEERSSVEDVFLGVDVPFDCEFLVAHPSGGDTILHEVYRVAKAWPLRSDRFGSWRPGQGLSAPLGGLYTRRHSLHGLTLRATNVHEPPLSTVSVVNETTHLDGFCGNVWRLLEKQMNFSTVHVIPDEGGNRWEEMMYQLVRGEADTTATYIVHTAKRDELVDFSIPLAIIPLRIFIAEPSGREVEWGDFLSPFSRSLWLAFLVSTLVAAALLALLYHVIRHLDHACEDVHSLADSVFLVFGSIFCQQGHANTPKTLPCRIVHIVAFLVGIIAINAYSGSLISNLAIFTHPLPFETMEGLYEKNDFAFGMPNKSLTHIQTKNATSGTLKRLYDRYIEDHPENTPVSNLEGFQRVCAIHYTFVALSESLTLLRDELNCSVTYLPQRFFSFSASLAFQKGSPYRGLFNHNLIRLLNGGVLGMLHKKALDERPSSPVDDVTPINLEAVAPMLSIVACGSCFALLLLLSECLISRRIFPVHAPRPRVVNLSDSTARVSKLNNFPVPDSNRCSATGQLFQRTRLGPFLQTNGSRMPGVAVAGSMRHPLGSALGSESRSRDLAHRRHLLGTDSMRENRVTYP